MCRGYVLISIDGTRYPAHRLAWLYIYGQWPNGQIDHINRNPSDNRIVNLREATVAENGHNAGLRIDNTSGFKGVHRHRNLLARPWQARIKFGSRRISLGYFETPEVKQPMPPTVPLLSNTVVSLHDSLREDPMDIVERLRDYEAIAGTALPKTYVARLPMRLNGCGLAYEDARYTNKNMTPDGRQRDTQMPCSQGTKPAIRRIRHDRHLN